MKRGWRRRRRRSWWGWRGSWRAKDRVTVCILSWFCCFSLCLLLFFDHTSLSLFLLLSHYFIVVKIDILFFLFFLFFLSRKVHLPKRDQLLVASLSPFPCLSFLFSLSLLPSSFSFFHEWFISLTIIISWLTFFFLCLSSLCCPSPFHILLSFHHHPLPSSSSSFFQEWLKILLVPTTSTCWTPSVSSARAWRVARMRPRLVTSTHASRPSLASSSAKKTIRSCAIWMMMARLSNLRIISLSFLWCW